MHRSSWLHRLVVNWDPVMLYAGGRVGWAMAEKDDSLDVNVVDNTALFDFDGKALPALDAYMQNTRGVSGGNIVGSVVDGERRPVRGVAVTAGGITVTTNRHGGFFVAGVETGVVDVTVSAGELGAAAKVGVSVAAGDTVNVDAIQLSGVQGLCDVSGMVQSSDGGSLDEAGVKLIDSSYGEIYATGTDITGAFTIRNVPAGAYTLEITKPGFVTLSEQVHVTDGMRVNRILEGDVGTISGMVLGVDDQPVAGAVVTLDDGGGTVTTSADGRFRFEGVLSGARTVAVTLEGCLSDEDDSVMVSQGGEAEVTLHLARAIPVLNPGFEEEGASGYDSIANWDVTQLPANSVIRQDRSGFGGAYEGRFGLSLWNESAYTAEVSQHLIGLEAGRYVLRAATYSGVTGVLTMQIRDESGALLAERVIEPSAGYLPSSLEFSTNGGNAVVTFAVDALAGDWAVIDAVEFGYLGNASVKDTENPDGTANPDSDTDNGSGQDDDRGTGARANNVQQSGDEDDISNTGAATIVSTMISGALVAAGVLLLALKRMRR